MIGNSTGNMIAVYDSAGKLAPTRFHSFLIVRMSCLCYPGAAPGRNGSSCKQVPGRMKDGGDRLVWTEHTLSAVVICSSSIGSLQG